MSEQPKRGAGRKADGDIQVVIRNRKARHDYHIDEDYEAGMVLTGSEVKSLRDSRASLADAYATVKNGELFLENAQIEPYPQASMQNHEPFRTRKLLMKKLEIRRLRGKLEEKGYTLIPLEIYLKQGRLKVQLGLAKGKKQWDKRAATRERDVRREMDQAAAAARKR